RNTFGVLLASDNAPGDFSEEEKNDPENFKEIARFIDKNAYIGVLRVKRDIGQESSLGLIGTTYSFIEKHNHLGGVDGRFRLDKQTVLSFQVLGTNSRNFFYDPDRDQSIYRTGNAVAYSWNYDYTSKNFGYFVGGEGRTRDYRADVGFTTRTNTNNQSFFLRYSTDPKPKAKLIFFRIVSFNNLSYDWQGRLTNRSNGSEVGLSFAKNTFVGGGGQVGYERIFEEEFGPKRGLTRQGAFSGDNSERSTNPSSIFMFIESNPTDKFSVFAFTGRRLNIFDFDFGAGPRYPRVSPAALRDPDAPLDPGRANAFDIEVGFNYKPVAALNASLDYERTRLTRKDTGRTVFVSNIYSLTSTFQFTRFTFVRARLDYDTLGSTLRGQYLFGWTPNPGTSFYLGYNDDLNYNGFSPFTNQYEPGFRRNGRTFFIKTSYLFRRSI
ncbi:MAG TPA: hypothetical protein VFQ92_17230, partial [Blastocatellia bacterium]|nr:hypothetical protein [Blastocatellia bacterium]